MAVARAARRLPDERNRCPITKIPPLCDASSVQAGTYAPTQIKDEHRGANDCPAYVSGNCLAGKLDAPYRKFKIKRLRTGESASNDARLSRDAKRRDATRRERTQHDAMRRQPGGRRAVPSRAGTAGQGARPF